MNTMFGLLRNRSFAALTVTQFLGALNDNAFKQLLLLLCLAPLAWVRESAWVGEYGQPLGAALFALPFVLFAATTGTLADKLSKSRIIRTSKWLEIAVMTIALVGFALHSMPVLFAAVFLMGAQSALFSPSKYGAIPELLEPEDLSRGNGLVQMTTMLAIIGGAALGGLLLQGFGDRLWIPGAVYVALAAAGTASAHRMKDLAPQDPGRALTFNVPGELREHWRATRGDRPLVLSIVASGFYWMIGATAMMTVNQYGDWIGLSELETSLMLGGLALGIGLGSLLAGKVSGDRIESGLVPLGLMGMGLALAAVLLAPDSAGWVATCLVAAGLSAGLFSIPIRALIQKRPAADKKGAVLGLSEFVDFSGIFLASGVFALLHAGLGLTPPGMFFALGVSCLVFMLGSLFYTAEFAMRLCVLFLIHTVYRIRIQGHENVPKKGGALLVCNHLSYVDPLLVGASVNRKVHFMMHRSFFKVPVVSHFARMFGTIPVASEDSPKEKLRSLRQAAELAAAGRVVCIFAEGAISRSGALLPFARGMEKIARRAGVPIIPVGLDGVYGSIFSFEGGKVFWKLPKSIPYSIDVRIGRAMPPEATCHEVRDEVQLLIAESRIEKRRRRGSLAGEFLRSARVNARRPAIEDTTGAAVDYRKLLIGSLALKAVLSRKLGSEKHVGVYVPQGVGGALANLAVTLLGKVAVNLNYTMPDSDLTAEDGPVAQTGMGHVISSRRFLKVLERPSPLSEERTLYLEDLRKEITALDKLKALLLALLPARVLARLLDPIRDRSEPATVIFSSGSTGSPKGVVLTHANILANLESVIQALSVTPSDRFLGVLPLFHSFGYTATLWAPLLRGAKVVYHANPTDAKTIGELSQQHGATIMLATPTFYQQYLRRCTPEQFSRIRIAAVGAEKLKRPLAEAWEAKMGFPLYEGYGTTELSPVVSFNLPDAEGMGARQRGSKPGTIGRAIVGVAVRVVDEDSGALKAPGEEGHLIVRGPNVMEGYLGKPELTREALPDGWYRTGDIGFLDKEAFLVITDRMARFSKIGGEMVPHGRVEDALNSALAKLGGVAPGVLQEQGTQLAVTSLPDDKKGERLVVVHTVLPVAITELVAELHEAGLPKLYAPRERDFVEVEGLPYLGTGKLDLRQLRELARVATTA